MITRDFIISNQMGLHMRPANVFVSAMTKYQSDVTIIFNNQSINGKSIMNIMAACIKNGAQIVVQCDGPDEVEMMDEVEELIESGFGED